MLSFAISVGESITLTALVKDLQRGNMGQQHISKRVVRILVLSHRRAAKAQASQRILVRAFASTMDKVINQRKPLTPSGT